MYANEPDIPYLGSLDEREKLWVNLTPFKRPPDLYYCPKPASNKAFEPCVIECETRESVFVLAEKQSNCASAKCY